MLFEGAGTWENKIVEKAFEDSHLLWISQNKGTNNGQKDSKQDNWSPPICWENLINQMNGRL